MVKANIDAQIEQLQKDLLSTENDILKLERLLEGITKQKNQLLSTRSDIIWKIEDLKECMEGDPLWKTKSN